MACCFGAEESSVRNRKLKRVKNEWKNNNATATGSGLLGSKDHDLSSPLNNTTPRTHDIFDAHLHITDQFGTPTEPIAMLECLNKNKVIGAAICMNQYVKKWGECETEKPEKAFYDQYPMSCVLYGDFLLWSLFHSDFARLTNKYNVALMPLMSSFDLTDKNCVQTLNDKRKLTGDWFKGIGQLNFRRGDITNLIRPVPNLVSHISKMFFEQVAGLNLPVILKSNATSMSTKAYAIGYEYVPEIIHMLQSFPNTPFVWVDFGINERGGYDDDYYYGETSVLNALLDRFPNLFCSITVNVLKHAVISSDKLAEVVKKYNRRFMVGSTIIGGFGDEKPRALYVEEINALRQFFKLIKDDGVINQVSSQNAIDLYTKKKGIIKGKENKNIKINVNLRKTLQETLGDDDIKFCELETESKEEEETSWNIIDCHLHLLDFLHKSSGTDSALKAMTDCGVSKAVLFGMPCCKKWCKDEPQQPLYYQDDNGECYFYSYADQMVADSWLSLDNESRKRFAPMIASFNPTDKHAIDHIRRMYNKYPNLWRGIGEIMCRHDDLSALLQEFEAPVVNHPALDAVYEFAIEKDLAVLVHHNSDRVADDKETCEWQYSAEVEEVLTKYPKLKFVWVHAGVSRRVHEVDHDREIDRLLSKHSNLRIDISWVVWEDVICDKNGKPKKAWVELIEKHNERVFLGSDQVGQFITIDGQNVYKKEILKYYKLLSKLTKTAAQNVAYKNAEREYFENWKCPLDLPQIKSIYPCEYLHHQSGTFVQKNQDTF